MVWSIAVTAGIGLLAGTIGMRVPFLLLASFVTAVAGAALTPVEWWPLWGVSYIAAMLTALQLAYLAGLSIACAFAWLRPRAEEKASVSERLSAGFAHWLWPSMPSCSV